MPQRTPTARVRFADASAVFCGGALGTMARAIVIPDAQPIGVFVVNLVGAFLLGVVVGALLRIATSHRAARWRLFLGTGLLGGFTTYSAFAVIATEPGWLWRAAAVAVAGPPLAFVGILTTRPRRVGGDG